MGTSMFDRGGQVVNHRRRTVSDGIEWGVYAWRMPDNKVLGDGHGNMLNIPSMRGDIEKMRMIQNYVNKELGIFKGEPFFMEGVMRLSQDEYDGQMEQMINGQTPSLDLGSLKDDLKEKKRKERGE